MDFRIAATFTESLARLTGDEQKAAKTTAFDLQMNPVHHGMSLHKLDRAKDPNFWSARVSRDIRLILHKTEGSLLLCYVDHHDPAYHWAERRKLETHPKTGAAQWVEIRERVEEVVVRRVVEAGTPAPKPLLFAALSDDELLGFGVPVEWLGDVRHADEDTLLVLADHLPAEAAEALLELATGGRPRMAPPPAVGMDPFSHPDAQRRFRVMDDVEALERALAYPWDQWTVFLHPAQRQWVERSYNGPARVAGSAGTGKTIVALHRAVFLARQHPECRVLLTTFSPTLASALATKLRRLIGNEPKLAERLEVQALDDLGERLHRLLVAPSKIVGRALLRQFIVDAKAASPGMTFSPAFLMAEWDDIVDAWQLDRWEAYRDVKRLGRKTRLSEAQRLALWGAFSAVRKRLQDEGLITRAQMFTEVATKVAALKQPPFDFVVVDEAQDLGIAQLRLLAAMSRRPDSLFFAGDLGQRIFQTPFSWKALGVDVRGRSRSLLVNYRTSHQIRQQADRLLGPEVSDVDGNTEERRGTVSVFNGPAPVIRSFADEGAEAASVASWIGDRLTAGMAPHEIGVFVRSDAQLPRAQAAAEQAKVSFVLLDDRVETTNGRLSICTMHLAKGLEFRAVAVMACDDEVIPLQERIEAITDDADLKDVYDTERHLLYVACTRARDCLLVTSVKPASEFLEDLEAE